MPEGKLLYGNSSVFSAKKRVLHRRVLKRKITDTGGSRHRPRSPFPVRSFIHGFFLATPLDPFLSLILTVSPSIMSASKAQSQKIFEKLKLKPANKVRITLPLVRGLAMFWPLFANEFPTASYASTAALRTRLGLRFLLVSTCVWIAQPTIATSVFTSPLFAPQISTVRIPRPLCAFTNCFTGWRLMDFSQNGNGSSCG